MRIVSENSEAELARQRAMGQVDWALRDLTANLLRVTRGAGKPREIGRQTQALLEALIAYSDAVGHLPLPEELANALTVELDAEVMQSVSDDSRAHAYAEQAIIRGSLQIAASRLLGQRTQERAGEHEMYDGFNRLEDIRTQERKKWARSRTVTKTDVKVAIAKIRAREKARLLKSSRKKPKG